MQIVTVPELKRVFLWFKPALPDEWKGGTFTQAMTISVQIILTIHNHFTIQLIT